MGYFRTKPTKSSFARAVTAVCADVALWRRNPVLAACPTKQIHVERKSADLVLPQANAQRWYRPAEHRRQNASRSSRSAENGGFPLTSAETLEKEASLDTVAHARRVLAGPPPGPRPDAESSTLTTLTLPGFCPLEPFEQYANLHNDIVEGRAAQRLVVGSAARCFGSGRRVLDPST